MMSHEVMERVEFNYRFHDDEGGNDKNVSLELRHESLNLPDICEMFEEFIRSAGFSVDGMLRYFRNEE